MHRKKGSLRDPMLDDVTDFKNMDEVCKLSIEINGQVLLYLKK